MFFEYTKVTMTTFEQFSTNSSLLLYRKKANIVCLNLTTCDHMLSTTCIHHMGDTWIPF